MPPQLRRRSRSRRDDNRAASLDRIPIGIESLNDQRMRQQGIVNSEILKCGNRFSFLSVAVPLASSCDEDRFGNV